MGSSSSKSSRSSGPSYSTDVVLYDQAAARQARYHSKSDFTSATALKDHLNPGDLIQQKGDTIKEWFYSHWAVYIGNGEIVHVTGVDGSSSKADIIRENMILAFWDKNVRKNNHMDDSFLPRGTREIVQTARRKVGTPWRYNLIFKNCEHFASLCRYGREISLQSFGLSDVKSGNITFKEYLWYHGKALKEKCSTFCSWIKRKVSRFLPAIGIGSYDAIAY
ncbi:phospholipase A and acyltransferase 2-like [Lytechinus variegatus]|uniref:phospholipase A and acyltransferase 2-like n=1 Tax=Lytechinus variegatus TaxID=7654 RepID=UPI001BB24DD4|nr:phospholipase A and acyltransferase 2-like [Lytechinus variegatus]